MERFEGEERAKEAGGVSAGEVGGYGGAGADGVWAPGAMATVVGGIGPKLSEVRSAISEAGHGWGKNQLTLDELEVALPS